jgi:hypothetical protein
MKRCLWIPGVLLLTTAAIAAPSDGVIVRTAALKESASSIAKSSTNLTPGTRVTVLERQGGWQNVSLQNSPNVKGWVRTYEVRTNIEPGSTPTVVKSKGSDGGVLGGLAGLSRASTGLFGKRENDQRNDGMVATIGVRGLSEADLKKAKPNPTEFAKLVQYGVDAETAKKYAQAGKLKSQAVDALAEVEPENKKKRKR